jgi:hypothetical protein
VADNLRGDLLCKNITQYREDATGLGITKSYDGFGNLACTTNY